MESTDQFIQKAYLYKNSSLYKEEYTPGFEPVLMSAAELPDITSFASMFAKGVLEIWAGKRPPAQLSKWCLASVYQELQDSIGFQKEIGKFRKIHISHPLDGLCEIVVTVRFDQRLRTMTMRFEGVDHKWLCTNLEFI